MNLMRTDEKPLDEDQISELVIEYDRKRKELPTRNIGESCKLYREYIVRIHLSQRPDFFRRCARLDL